MTDEVLKPHVIIIGAGIGGLSLAAILERANMSYDVYERAPTVKHLGSAIALGPGAMPFFDQLGVLDQILERSKIVGPNFTWNEQMELQSSLPFGVTKEEFGYEGVVIARPALHQILLNQIPVEKIHFGKRILSHVETGDGVIIRTSDGKQHFGNILIGADGAYSSVRQTLYEQVDKQRALPKSDKEPLRASTVCLLGQTTPLDPAIHPALEERNTRFDTVIGEEVPYFWATFTTADRTICWVALLLLDEKTSREHSTFRSSEWGSEAAESMAKQIRDFPIPCGAYKTMGDLIDLTPKDLISKVMLEEKLFKTWHDGRTVLLGDACHKMTPNAGLGATTAIHDAIVLGNYLSTLRTNNIDDITSIFLQYQEERTPMVKDAIAASSAFAKLIGKV
ncbi:hypothetical protein BGZ54_008122 [Gamsiella multidivaricata]|nr:hypothetical protein BGZ54_008122 [Gamsiella multidivaricata]